MFIKKLIIFTPEKTIRELNFKKGLNLIVDNNDNKNNFLSTGNNVGKTTILKLINYCFGGTAKSIYAGDDKATQYDTKVEKFLLDKNVTIKLELIDSFEDTKKIISIERNFKKNKNENTKINGEKINSNEISNTLKKMCFSNIDYVPNSLSFKNLISHNIRYHNDLIEKTLDTLGSYAKELEYEILYLFLLGFNVNVLENKNILNKQYNEEKAYYKKTLENKPISFYKAKIDFFNTEIEKLIEKRNKLNVNINYEQNLKRLNEIKFQKFFLTKEISILEFKRNWIQDSISSFNRNKANIDNLNELKNIYSQVKYNFEKLNKSFENLCNFHNEMNNKKIEYFSKDLDKLIKEIIKKNSQLNLLINNEKIYQELINKSNEIIDYNEISNKIFEFNNDLGKFQKIYEILSNSNIKIEKIKQSIEEYKNFYEEKFKHNVEEKILKFNNFYSNISEKMYSETYQITAYIEKTKKGGFSFYKFDSYNFNSGSGKKQGEIICFDIAYILFADDSKIPCCHFLLNDKKELVHNNQLSTIANIANESNIQLIFSILSDKIPLDVKNKSNIVVELSQDDKLFRMEKYEDL